MKAETDIVIIGAGAAGAAAARGLAGTGLDILVLEARPRPGGRACTEEIAGMRLDLGCAWLHSADRNPFVPLAESLGFEIDRRAPGWRRQHRDLGFPAADQDEARAAFAAWSARVASAPPASDVAADLLDHNGRWNAYLQAMSGFISGNELEHISARDYAAYDMAATDLNWRLPAGYGTLVAASLPASVELVLSMPVRGIGLDRARVRVETEAGTIAARAVIVTASTSVLAGGAITLPPVLDPWRHAAHLLPLGRNEKLFLEITADGPFEPDSRVLGDPHDPATGTYNIRPFGWPVIECFLGGAGARAVTRLGHEAAFARAVDQLAALFGEAARRCLRPLLASDWAGAPSIGGAYSHARPGHAAAREALARPHDGRIFFAGEATHRTDFSTAHGAHLSGLRAAAEVRDALAVRPE